MLARPDRAKLAKKTIYENTPEILKHDTKALNGVKNTVLIAYNPQKDPPRTSPASASTSSGDAGPSTSTSKPTLPLWPIFQKAPLTPPKAPISSPSPSPSTAQPKGTLPKIRVVKSDTFDAAASIISSLPPLTPSTKLPSPHIAVLNMASAKTPGGGVLSGAMAQEESLCLRSTLYASLTSDNSFYRIPELSGIFSPDVLVFRSSDSPWPWLPRAEQYYSSVISIAALKNPDLVKNSEGKNVYAHEGDKQIMISKIRLIFQIAKEKGITHLVLGALGCGVYYNPPEEVAKMFRRVLLGDRKRGGVTIEESGVREVVFAIFDEGPNLRSFRDVLGDL